MPVTTAAIASDYACVDLLVPIPSSPHLLGGGPGDIVLYVSRFEVASRCDDIVSIGDIYVRQVVGASSIGVNKLEVAVGREVGGHRGIGRGERVVSASVQRVRVLVLEDA
jgi:hypothetical protein